MCSKLMLVRCNGALYGVDIGRQTSEVLWSVLGIQRHLVDWVNAGHVIIMESTEFRAS